MTSPCCCAATAVSTHASVRRRLASSIYSLNWLRKVSTHASVRRRRVGGYRPKKRPERCGEGLGGVREG